MKYEKISSVYRLKSAYAVRLEENFKNCICKSARFEVDSNIIYLYKGFSWDGSSGVKDTKYCMVASAVHDALCHMNDKLYSGSDWRRTRKKADKEYKRLCIEHGMTGIRGNIRYAGIRIYGVLKGVFK